MELKTIRSGNKDSFFNKEYNLGVGIGLGNRWFIPDNIFKLIKFALSHTKNNVVVYVADTIHATNIQVRKRKTREMALAEALYQGEETLKEVEDLCIKNLEQIDFSKIVFANWSDIEEPAYSKKTLFVHEYFGSNNEFKNKIASFVRDNVSKEKRNFSNEQIIAMSVYVLDELAELVCRLKIKGVSCDAWLYPTDSVFCAFVEDLQKGIIFPEIKNSILDTEPKVFCEVND